MYHKLDLIDITLLLLYMTILVGMGVYYLRKCRTADQFMVAGRSIPAWAAGLAVMSAYTSSISYIATPGKAFDSNWHPLIFSLSIFPVAWFVTRKIIPYYRKTQIISVYGFLEEKLGAWGRIYAAFSFLLYMVGRIAVILYLAALLLHTFMPIGIGTIIVIIGVITILYTLMGGMESVIWTDVMQSSVMIVGILFCAGMLTARVFSGPTPLIETAVTANKFSLGALDFSMSTRTIWVMIVYGVTENLRNLMADQNFVQKYSSVPTEREAKRSVWIAMLIYIPLTVVFLYIGTALFAFYSPGGETLPSNISKGDQVFPFFIATQVPVGLKGLIIAAVLAAAMSTVDSALNCSATVLLLDFTVRFIYPNISEAGKILYLRLATVLWGMLGIGFALLMINAKSALDTWWQISGVFGGGILGLFILSLLGFKLRLWQGLTSIAVSITVISWGTFARDLTADRQWAECHFDPIIVGAVGTVSLLLIASVFGVLNKMKSTP